MDVTALPTLTPDEIDDLLYFTRVNEVQDLQQTITELSQKHNCAPKNILEAGIDPESGNTVLHYGSANGFDGVLSMFLSTVNDAESAKPSQLINHANREGNTSLHWAAYNGHLAIVKLLVTAGADMWLKNSAGHLPMFEAERADKSEVVQYLLEAGGKEVETGGTEAQPSAQDIAEVQSEEASSSSQAARGAESTGAESRSSG